MLRTRWTIPGDRPDLTRDAGPSTLSRSAGSFTADPLGSYGRCGLVRKSVSRSCPPACGHGRRILRMRLMFSRSAPTANDPVCKLPLTYRQIMRQCIFKRRHFVDSKHYAEAKIIAHSRLRIQEKEFLFALLHFIDFLRATLRQASHLRMRIGYGRSSVITSQSSENQAIEVPDRPACRQKRPAGKSKRTFRDRQPWQFAEERFAFHGFGRRLSRSKRHWERRHAEIDLLSIRSSTISRHCHEV